jgi:hypothetical protein
LSKIKITYPIFILIGVGVVYTTGKPDFIDRKKEFEKINPVQQANMGANLDNEYLKFRSS